MLSPFIGGDTVRHGGFFLNERGCTDGEEIQKTSYTFHCHCPINRAATKKHSRDSKARRVKEMLFTIDRLLQRRVTKRRDVRPKWPNRTGQTNLFWNIIPLKKDGHESG